MPWRHTTDPYKILVSEIMLQQTQVSRVLVKYEEFIRVFPDFKTLARAPLSKILGVWQGMGYNRRAVFLKKLAEIVAKDYKGKLPQDPVLLEKLPGIGKATAGSICAFAFNLPVTFIETNIRRVFIHFFFKDTQGVHDNDLLPLVEAAVDKKHAREWYWALMDYGTMLGKLVPNPNRTSAHYVRQSAFRGSDRAVRGKILAYLLKHKSATLGGMSKGINEPLERTKKLTELLKQEGFLRKNRNSWNLIR